ncbi:hypothetical protein [Haliangium ochraceum]|uniref:Uncharacterized protein n=1 Tax=Haliangium ochraceum (strain DSM 14365 / JCM 11303 / SMP-2) TaxID=502025 RepID=D0LR20_HALO1|nr:hypothetical protein [Haliangium ochraceum]ACY15528.1 conserved hypothetical protein [Haliangium ochraceum DSM 14365]
MTATNEKMRIDMWFLGIAIVVLGTGIVYMVTGAPGPIEEPEARAPGPALGVDAGAAVAPVARAAPPPDRRVRPSLPALPERRIADTVSIAAQSPDPEAEPDAQDTDTQPDSSASISAAAGAMRPVVGAIRRYHASPEDKRRAMIAALSESGASREPWTREADAVFASWRSALQGDAAGAATLGQARCYQDGCAVEVRFASSAAYEAARKQFHRLGPGVSSLGGRVQTPPEELGDGQLVVTWMALRPDERSR